MADRKAVNRYYPPDFDPTKHGSINKYRNSHPLRERAKRLSEGILVIRFEMPYNIWCGGCGKHIGMGVRYNAEKTKVGNYYTTPIYRFRMKCHLCDHYFEMETNPMECDYTIVTGAYRKNQKWDMAENEQVLTEDRETVKKLAADPMFKLEHGVDDTKKLEAVAPTLHELEQTQTSWKDDFDQNKMLRKKFRTEKNELKAAEARDKALLSKSSLDIVLVPEHDDDKKLASLMKYSAVETYDEKQKKKRLEISNRSIFSSKSSTSSSSSSTPASLTTSLSPPKEHKTLDLQKRLGLVDKLKAAKRSKTGFDDFGTCPDRKIARPNRAIGIVTSKRRKDTRDNGDERVNSNLNDSDRSEQVAPSKSLLFNVDGKSSLESESSRGKKTIAEDSQKAYTAKLEQICTVAEEHCSESPDINRTTENISSHICVTESQSRVIDSQDEFSSDSKTLKTHQQVGISQDSCPTGTDLTRIDEHLVQSEARLDESRVNKNSEEGIRSLVSCDYSSSDSD